MLALAAFVVAAAASKTLEAPALPREFRGVWVATVANIDWPSKPGVSTDQAKAEMIAILNKCQALHFNAVIWQVRPCADALYPSKIEPWSEFLTGKQGRAPNPLWDPIEFGVREAHKRGIEFHCWFNPYRAKHSIQKGLLSMDHVSNAKPEIVREYGDFLWMDPGEKETQRETLSVISDVVRRYDIDGVHIDDYFYPYKSYAGGEDFPDDRPYNAYRNAGGRMARDDWRRANVDSFVEDLYATVHKLKPWVRVGISPFGIYRPGQPSGITGMDQFAQLYADPLQWWEKGWCDYLTPQLYWTIGDTPHSYRTLLTWWAAHNSARRNLWPGNYTSKTDRAETEGAATWPAKEIIDQIELTRKTEGATGNVHFSMRAIMHNAGGIADALRKEYAEPALVPASPWLADGKPTKPNLRPTGDKSGGRMSLFWGPGAGSSPLRWVCVYARVGSGWNRQVFSADDSTVTAPSNATAVVMTVVDRVGQESPPAVWPEKYMAKLVPPGG